MGMFFKILPPGILSSEYRKNIPQHTECSRAFAKRASMGSTNKALFLIRIRGPKGENEHACFLQFSLACRGLVQVLILLGMDFQHISPRAPNVGHGN